MWQLFSQELALINRGTMSKLIDIVIIRVILCYIYRGFTILCGICYASNSPKIAYSVSNLL